MSQQLNFQANNDNKLAQLVSFKVSEEEFGMIFSKYRKLSVCFPLRSYLQHRTS